jgi:hypothetical protein
MNKSEEETTSASIDKHSVDEWLVDILNSLHLSDNEGDLLLDGDGGDDYLAGIEDEEQRQRVRDVQGVLKRAVQALTKGTEDETKGIFL